MNQIEHMGDDDVKNLVRQHWGGRAADFDERSHHGLHSVEQHRAWLAVLADLTGSTPIRVLDVGCGTGFLSLLLAELGHQVTGVDLTEEMIDLALQKAEKLGLDVEFRIGDAEQLSDADEVYDLIVARHLIWTLPNPTAAVREWTRVLQSGGRLALVEGNWGSNPAVEYEQIHQRLPFYGGQPSERLTQFLAAEGFRDVIVKPLMDEVLWGEKPQYPRYLVTGLCK